ncbi:hypothetical protein BU17DRAFT_63108 [Hysterangium stoloniferum]|nr:hypothetical protein BU17DRAFT_63108 [Hysterangium stoloniferum]
MDCLDQEFRDCKAEVEAFHIWPELPSVDMDQHMRNWISFLESHKWIKEFCTGAGIDVTLTHLSTHCFRRGGSQYRFMLASVGKRWTLATIRWWGGWAEGEHEGHGDALRPIQREVNMSFLDESRGLHKPLKDWPTKWKTHPAFAMSYRARKLIAEEYILICRRDTEVFLKKWPMAVNGTTELTLALRCSQRRRYF